MVFGDGYLVLVLLLLLLFIIYIKTEGQQSQCQMNWEPRKREGVKRRWGPSYTKDRHVKNNNHITPPRATHQTHQAKDNPHAQTTNTG